MFLWAGRPVEQTIDCIPHREPFIAFVGGQLFERAGFAETGQVGIGPPLRQHLIRANTGRSGAAVERFGPHGQVGGKPDARLITPARPIGLAEL